MVRLLYFECLIGHCYSFNPPSYSSWCPSSRLLIGLLGLTGTALLARLNPLVDIRSGVSGHPGGGGGGGGG